MPIGGHALSAAPIGAQADTLTIAPVTGYAAAASPLGSPALVLQHDFSALMGDLVSLYVVDLVTPGGTVRVPVSSWQGTLQTDAASYLQCVIPACAPWLAAIDTATEFIVWRRAVLPSGTAMEYEMARSPAEQVQYDRGEQRYTCTLSGYSAVVVPAAVAEPLAVYDRTLTGLRSLSRGTGGARARCAIDWLLRPGHKAIAAGMPFTVAYINYYAPAGFDAYMDVGIRGA